MTLLELKVALTRLLTTFRFRQVDQDEAQLVCSNGSHLQLRISQDRYYKDAFMLSLIDERDGSEFAVWLLMRAVRDPRAEHRRAKRFPDRDLFRTSWPTTRAGAKPIAPPTSRNDHARSMRQPRLDHRDVKPDAWAMRSNARWWDGPWPWLAYLVTYGIPWLWVPPGPQQLLLSAVAIGVFLAVYFRSFHLTGRALAGSVALMVAIGVALVPVGGGWSVLAVYPAMQAARLRPRRAAIGAILLSVVAFLVAGILSRQPPTWWLPSLMLPALIGGAALSREAFYDRTRALLATQEEVRRLAGIAERERMARDVHDVIGRTLTLVALKADLVERLAGRDGEAASREARSIGDQARAGFAEIRAALDGHASGSLASEIAASVAALDAANIQAEVRGDRTAIPPNAGAILAMTLREAVTNVIRHADARRCSIGLTHRAGRLTLTVADDGAATSIVEGNGLTGMRHRMVAAGGELVIRSDAGTTLVASVPA